MEQDFEIKQDGTTLNIFLGKELSATNANKLTEALDSYYGQGIEKGGGVVGRRRGRGYQSAGDWKIIRRSAR